MTGASKLFHSRRIQFGVRDNADDRDSRHITTNRRHHHLISHNDHRRLDGCNSSPRRIHRHRLSNDHPQEHDQVQIEPGGSQSLSGSIINSEDFRSIRRWGATGNDRLPGVVLLARERLLERLRGVHVSENRQISRSSSRIHEDELLYNGYSSVIEEERVLVSGSWEAVMATRMLPAGLSEDAMNCLSIKVYKSIEEKNERSRECSICLEGFEDGDELINLPCFHRFHSCCLFPWVEVCGACPNCRKPLL